MPFKIAFLQNKVQATFNLKAVSYSIFKNPHLINSLLFLVQHPLRCRGIFLWVAETPESYFFKVVIHIAALEIDSDDEISPLSIFHAVGGRAETQGDTL